MKISILGAFVIAGLVVFGLAVWALAQLVKRR